MKKVYINNDVNLRKEKFILNKFTIKELLKFFIFDLLGEKKYSKLVHYLFKKNFLSKMKLEKKFNINDVNKFIFNEKIKLNKTNFDCIEIINEKK